MSSSVIATLANKKYISQAKQLFSSVYHTSGWKGDYLLITDGIPLREVQWFQNRGILVKTYSNKDKREIGIMPSIVGLKLRLFTRYFKKWDTVLYIDADAIVTHNLDFFEKVKGFWAAPDLDDHTLGYQFRKNDSFKKMKDKHERLRQELLNDLDFTEPSFNSGVLAFETSVIKKNTFQKLKKFQKKYNDISYYGDQSILNFYFYKQWQKLPLRFNTSPEYIHIKYFLPYFLIWGTILHFCPFGNSAKPWQNKSYFQTMWKHYLLTSDEVNLTQRKRSKTTNIVKKMSFNFFYSILSFGKRIF
ncbi:MAG: glycosyltransferase [Patescibacteria group bacterium]